MARFCPNCGTEVDETAVFCPTCGQPIDQGAEVEMPEAPAWPEPRVAAAPEGGVEPTSAQEAPVQPALAADEPEEPAAATAPPPAAPPEFREQPTRVEDRPAVPMPRRPARGSERRGAASSVQLTPPVTLTGWLIGGGAVLAAIGLVVGLFPPGGVNPIDLLLLVGLLWIAATVFLSSAMPQFGQLRLTTLVIVLIGFGMALDRIGFGAAGAADLLLFLGTAAAAIGAVLLELGHDQPLGGPQS